MKNYSFGLLALFVALSVSSCKDDAIVDNTTTTPIDCEPGEALCHIEDLYLDNDPAEEENYSRSALLFSQTKGMLFKWDINDKLTIFCAEDAAENSTSYKVTSVRDDKSATFASQGLILRKNSRYYGISKDASTAVSGFSNANRNEIVVSYEGQKQIGNGTSETNTAHLGQYDYMAATGMSDTENRVDFTFKHLGLVLYTIFNFNPDKYTGIDQTDLDNSTWTKIEMYADDNDFLKLQRTIDLRNGLKEDGTYSPYLNDVDLASLTADEKVTHFALDLREHTDENCTGKVDGKCPHGVSLTTDGTGNKRKLQTFIQIPPITFDGDKRFIFRLTGKTWKRDASGNYEYESDGVTHKTKEFNFYTIYKRTLSLKAGSAAMMTMTPIPTSDFRLKVKLHLDWKNKSLFDYNNASRAVNTDVPEIGDPEDAERFCPPTYLYAWVFVNGALQHTRYMCGDELKGKWTKTVDTYVYEGNFGFDFSIAGNVDSCTAYVTAATSKLLADDDVIQKHTDSGNEVLGTIKSTVGTTEEAIRSLTFDVPKDASNNAIMDSIINIWSTPYSATNYIGNVKTGMNINLHHVAAKVDLQWNSPYQVLEVGVDKFQTTGLKLFEPTENEGETMTARIQNNTFSTDGDYTGWTKGIHNGGNFNIAQGCAEFWNSNTFDFYQTITDLPAGTYKITCQGFYRDGGYVEADRRRSANPSEETFPVSFYVKKGGYSAADASSVAIKSIFDKGSGLAGIGTSTNHYGLIPNNMWEANQYFNASLYVNELSVTLESAGSITIGIRRASGFELYDNWCIFDNFTLSSNFNGGGQTIIVPDVDRWYYGRQVFYIPQYKPDPNTKKTYISAISKRKNAEGGDNARETTSLPFVVEDVFTTWFRGNVVVQ